ncbi:MAG: carboxylating nicotinate-nucleotide diphosphorylase [Acidobacteriota bacterium]|nr:carboxylating nicotinate-nucleotide diphosphorylase [Acidobacteriota bacterium]
MKVVPFGALDPALYREVVRRALAEDLGWGDLTTDATVTADQRARGVLMVKSPCVLAGLDLAAETFRQLDPAVSFTPTKRDGDACRPGEIAAEVTGGAASLLTAERTALNFVQRLSGIATLTRRYVEASGGRITVLDTRKTTPTLRALEKYAVRAGGAVNHRMALDDGILIKDNHIHLAGGVKAALDRMREAKPDMPIEIEVQSLREADEALACGADILLVDNMSTDDIRQVVRRAGGRVKIEISGGVTLDRLPELAATGADYVSVGALTHSAPAADLSFEIEPA